MRFAGGAAGSGGLLSCPPSHDRRRLVAKRTHQRRHHCIQDATGVANDRRAATANHGAISHWRRTAVPGLRIGVLDLNLDAASPKCVRCGTELAARTLACPSCSMLVHREQLQQLAQLAESATSTGDAAAARTHWTDALDLVPIQSE